ncbi:hypothetical protein H1S01_01515 [Heliobacterium chlorum]|uniref:DUF1614 domain-containing protein n=1 Tax=Heliobacterium chlorum TaxID=2698 RepID=A0ABR7SXA2_HELCL|nr:hypothetical protein [Heliobacterium chlorum]MBC9783185.1 hypothetical protein [Heliobacterium chlorum]
MPRYPIGAIILLVSMIFILFGMGRGLAQRLRTPSRRLLFFLLAWWAASFIDVPIPVIKPSMSMNLGGIVAPLCLGLLLTGKTKLADIRLWMAVLSVMVSGLLGQEVLGFEQDHFLWDGHWIFTFLGALAAATVAVEMRGALAAVLLGGALAETIGPFVNLYWHLAPGRITELGAGIVFDRIVVSSLLVFPLSFIIEHLSAAKAVRVNLIPKPIDRKSTKESLEEQEIVIDSEKRSSE